MDNFTIIALTEDFGMSALLANISNSIDCLLEFVDADDIGIICKNTKLGVLIVDLDYPSVNPYEIVKKIRSSSQLVICGFKDQMNKIVRKKAENSGFDLVFPKTMFKQNLTFIIEQSKIES